MFKEIGAFILTIVATAAIITDPSWGMALAVLPVLGGILWSIIKKNQKQTQIKQDKKTIEIEVRNLREDNKHLKDKVEDFEAKELKRKRFDGIKDPIWQPISERDKK